MKSVQIPLKAITVKFFVRTGLNPDHVKFLKDLYESGEPVSPIEVAELSKGQYELIDGRHRIAAVTEAGYASVDAIVHKGLADGQKVLYAVLANVGGALPPSLADFEHSMELLINLKMPKKEILENFPLPKPVVSNYYKLTLGKIYKRTVRNAVELVLRGNASVKEAAAKYKVEIGDLRSALNSNQKRESNVDDLISSLEYSIRSLGQHMSKKSQIILEQYEAGEMGPNDVRRWTERLKQSIKRLQSSSETSRARLEAALETSEAANEKAAEALVESATKKTNSKSVDAQASM